MESEILKTEIKDFETDNIYQSSTITCITKIPPKFKPTGDMVHFVYPATEEVLKAAQDFFNGVLVNVYLFSTILKKIRGEMLSKRKEICGA